LHAAASAAAAADVAPAAPGSAEAPGLADTAPGADARLPVLTIAAVLLGVELVVIARVVRVVYSLQRRL
jgi:hypothetical protein